MKRQHLDALRETRAARRTAVLITDLESHAQNLVVDPAEGGLPAHLEAAVRKAVGSDRSGVVETEAGTYFIQVFNPPLRMIVVGAVHIAQALVPMAQIAGYQVTVIDPRRSFASEARFPDVAVRTEWPDEAMADIALDHRCAVVTLTHDPKLDDPALAAALASPCFYIGALGSKRTHASRLQRLREAGLDETTLARIAGPIGLPIGAKSPAEIAVAILGQVTETLRKEKAA